MTRRSNIFSDRSSWSQITLTGIAALGEVYVQKAMYDEAIAHMQKYVELTEGRTDYALGYLGYAYAMAGQRDKALEMLETLQDRAKRQYVIPYAFAPLYVGLGENDKAIEALWRDYEERATPFLLWVKVFPVFDRSAFRPQVHRASAQDRRRAAMIGPD